jgi:hypothetical protein
MSGTTERQAEARSRSAGRVRATGTAVSAAWIMITLGAFEAVEGLGAVAKDDFYGRVANYLFDFDVTAWGWLHLVVGVIAVLTGVFILRGAPWARPVGIALAAVSAVVNFLFIPYYPLWSMTVVALAVAVVRALSAHEPEW